jgi:hypothetical protein
MGTRRSGGVWKKDQPLQDYPVQPSDYTPSTSIQVLAPEARSSQLPCKSPFCNKISLITCPCQFYASDCQRGPGGLCTTHTLKPSKQKTTMSLSRPSTVIPSQQGTGSMQPSVFSDDKDLALAIKASLQPLTSSHQSAHLFALSSLRRQSPSFPVSHSDALSLSKPSSFQSLPTTVAVKPHISSQMGPAWQEKIQASSKAAVEKEERAARQAKLQQALKENLNILFFDKVMLVHFTCFNNSLKFLLQNNESVTTFKDSENLLKHYLQTLCLIAWMSILTIGGLLASPWSIILLIGYFPVGSAAPDHNPYSNITFQAFVNLHIVVTCVYNYLYVDLSCSPFI